MPWTFRSARSLRTSVGCAADRGDLRAWHRGEPVHRIGAGRLEDVEGARGEMLSRTASGRPACARCPGVGPQRRTWAVHGRWGRRRLVRRDGDTDFRRRDRSAPELEAVRFSVVTAASCRDAGSTENLLYLRHQVRAGLVMSSTHRRQVEWFPHAMRALVSTAEEIRPAIEQSRGPRRARRVPFA